MSREEVAALVREVIGEILPGIPTGKVAGDRHLRELGADSVDRVEIVLTMLDRSGVREPLAAFTDLPDIDALVDFLWERMQ